MSGVHSNNGKAYLKVFDQVSQGQEKKGEISPSINNNIALTCVVFVSNSRPQNCFKILKKYY